MKAIFRLGRLHVGMVCIVLTACAAALPGLGAAAGANPYGAFLAARFADAQSDPQTAIHFYSSALAADPANASLRNESFITALLAGSPAAVPLATQIPGNALGLMLLGNQAAAAGHFAAAQASFAGLPDDDLAGLLKPLLIAWAQAGAGNAQAALAGLAPYFTTPGFGAVFVLNAALIADESGDSQAASRFYADAVVDQPNLRLAQILASWQARTGQLAAARAQLAQLAAAHPDLAIALPVLLAQSDRKVISSPAQGMAEAYLMLAGTLDQPAQILLRTTLLRFALALRPDLSAARLLLATILTGGGQAGPVPPVIPPAAERAALAALAPIGAQDALFAPAALQEAQLLAAMNRPAEAVALLQQLAATVPDNPGPVEAMGDILRGNGQFQQAISDYDRAIALAGTPPPPTAWPLYFDRAICRDQLGNWQAAQPDMMRALALAPNQPYVLNYIGYSWALHGEKLGQAATMLAQAVSLDPHDGAVIDSLGYVKLRQGQTSEAVALLTQAVELQPDDAEVNAHLGDAFAQAGMSLQAQYQWQRALALAPDARLQGQLLAKLKQVEPAKG